MNAVSEGRDQADWVLYKKIRNGNKKAFEELFFSYYYDLCTLATQITKSSDCARDVVQDVFLRLWCIREEWNVKTSLHAYLYKAVWNESLNARKKQRARYERKEQFARHQLREEHPSQPQSYGTPCKLIEKVWEIVAMMPERRQQVFRLHRKHGLSYKEISSVMNISRKTVENHMGLALQEIRNAINPDLFD